MVKWLIVLILSTSLLAGCGSDDKQYSSDNPDNASKIVQDFYSKINQAVKTTDIEQQSVFLEEACSLVSGVAKSKMGTPGDPAFEDSPCPVEVDLNFLYVTSIPPRIFSIESGEGELTTEGNLQVVTVPVDVEFLADIKDVSLDKSVVIEVDIGEFKIGNIKSLSLIRNLSIPKKATSKQIAIEEYRSAIKKQQAANLNY